MDAQKLKRRADFVRGKMLMITGYAKAPVIIEKLQSMLEGANLERILIETCPDFFEWLEALPKEQVPGLAEACRSWIHHWGQGGGDCSTEDQIKAAIDDLYSGQGQDVPNDMPHDLADAMYCSVADYCQTPFEASVLVMNIMDECLTDCQAKASKQEQKKGHNV